MHANDPFYRDMATLLTIHNIGYQGVFPREQFPKLGLDWSLFSVDGLEFYGKVNILKGGLIFADLINTVSPTYSLEIQEKKFGFGLDGLLRRRRNALFGILNGIDYSIWNPQTDRHIVQNYSSNTVEEKSLCKQDLQKNCKLPVKKDVPVVGIVSRLAEQKGFDLIGKALKEMCAMDVQLVILGTGDLKYHKMLEEAVKECPQSISLNLKFDDPLAHKIYAGSDIFLMPSQYEPCGLRQLIAFRYGAVPLVFKTGGLADTVTSKNGFSFDDYSKGALLKTLKKAVKTYHDQEKWGALVKKAMDSNFSWKESSRKYLRLYAKAQTV
jgi:starch synthase